MIQAVTCTEIKVYKLNHIKFLDTTYDDLCENIMVITIYEIIMHMRNIMSIDITTYGVRLRRRSRWEVKG